MACACSTATSPLPWRGDLQVDFYHLTATPIERALPRIAERVVAGGDRLLVVAGDAERCAAIDGVLWSYTADSFLPHARAGGEADADQPVLIAEEPVAANGARMVAMTDGKWRDEALGFERAFHFFDDQSLAAARTAWRALARREGIERRYWKQDERGRWEQAG